MIDFSAGVKVACKGGPGITKSDLLITNKIDIAEQIHAYLGVKDGESKKMRDERPFLLTDLHDGVGLETIVSFILERSILPERRPGKVVEPA